MGSVFLILIGFLLLVVGGEFLVRASVGLSFKLKLSKMVIGLTVVSFATSAPELLVSLQAAFELLFSFGLFMLLKQDNLLSSNEGIGLVVALILYLFFLIRRAKKNKEIDGVDDNLASSSYIKIIIWLIIGGTALYFGSEWLVSGAKKLAAAVGVSDAVISMTVVAIGTSVPELAASIIAALKKEKAISLGNLIGSNIFNIASVLGLTAIVKPLVPNDPSILSTNIFWMIGFAVALFPLVYISPRLKLNRVKGLLLFIAYIAFIGIMIF